MNLPSTHNKVRIMFMILLILKVSQKGFKKSQWHIQVQVKTERAVGLPGRRNSKGPEVEVCACCNQEEGGSVRLDG